MSAIVSEDSAGTKHVSVFDGDSTAAIAHYVERKDPFTGIVTQQLIWFRPSEPSEVHA